jgi:hypothetical protein
MLNVAFAASRVIIGSQFRPCKMTRVLVLDVAERNALPYYLDLKQQWLSDYALWRSHSAFWQSHLATAA